MLRDHANTAGLEAGCTFEILKAMVVFHKYNHGSGIV